MKKLFALLLSVLMILSLAACGSKDAADSDAAYIEKNGKVLVGITIYEPMNYYDENGELTGFDTEFAQAVCQSDRHFGDCLKAVVKGVTNSLSDIEAYTRAVQFYFPGATLSVKMLIDVGDGVLNDVTPDPEAPTPPLEISLDNLLDW